MEQIQTMRMAWVSQVCVDLDRSESDVWPFLMYLRAAFRTPTMWQLDYHCYKAPIMIDTYEYYVYNNLLYNILKSFLGILILLAYTLG